VYKELYKFCFIFIENIRFAVFFSFFFLARQAETFMLMGENNHDEKHGFLMEESSCCSEETLVLPVNIKRSNIISDKIHCTAIATSFLMNL